MAKRKRVPEGQQRIRVATGIYLKANGKYLATFRDPGRKQHWREFHTSVEAERWRAQALLDPRSIATGRRTLSEVWVSLLLHHGAAFKHNTLLSWKQEWKKHIEPALGQWPVGKITIPAVKDFLADLERRGVGTPTRAKCRTILHRILEEALENGEILSNPASAQGTRIKQAQRKKARALSPEEVIRLVDTAQRECGASDALAVEIMFWLGLRLGEMAGLQARDISFTDATIVIQRTVMDTGGTLRVQESTKSNRPHPLPLPSGLPLVSKLADHIRSQGLIGQAHLFQAPKGGPIRPNNWRRRVWTLAMTAADIQEPPTPHAGRRTTVSLLAAAGVPPSTIQAIVGHSTLQQTGEYLDVSRASMEDAMSRLAALYGHARAAEPEVQ